MSRPDSNGATVLLWCWLIGCTLLLSLSHSKLVTYIWPVFPAVAVLAAVGWGRLIAGTLTGGARRLLVQTLVGSCVGGPLVLPAALLVVQGEFAVRFSQSAWIAAAVTAAGALVPLIFVFAGRMRPAFVSALLAATAQFAAVMIVVLPQVTPAASAHDVADHFNRLGRIPPNLLFAEGRIGSLVFYLEKDLRAGLRERQIRQVCLHRFPRPLPGALVVLAERRIDTIGQHLDLSGLTYESTGRHRVYRAADVAQRLTMTGIGPQGTLRR